MSSLASRLQVYEPVAEALAFGKPVVALESTILSHGLPYPENLELAKSLASLFRDQGVEPATIAVGRRGQCHIGLHPNDLEDLCQARLQDRAQKISTRDLPLFIATAEAHAAATTKGITTQSNKEDFIWGATTVASTMRLAHAAGIATFVTGGMCYAPIDCGI
jgi:pseudouridine-5'-phosphate glycosidase